MQLSPLIKESLKKDSPLPKAIRCIVEVREEKFQYVLSQLKEMGLSPNTELISHHVDSVYIPVVLPTAKILEFSRIEGVKAIHKSMPRAVGGMTTRPIPSPYSVIEDELLGKVFIPAVEVPRGAIFEALPNPISLAKAAGSLLSQLTGGINPLVNVEIFTTSQTAKIVRDVGTKAGEGVTLAVLDTGGPSLTYQFFGKWDKLECFTVIPEPPQDAMGHGSWCHTAACGSSGFSPYGTLVGMAPNVKSSIHVKCLNTFPGMGTSEGILKAIEIAVRRGAEVISMSLGGPSQGNSIDGDIESKVVNKLSERGHIFVVAAGNSGPDYWTIGSPGGALKCVSCASASITDKFQPASWSSRGPGTEWDKKHQEEWSSLLKRYGDELLKPDVSCLGGGKCLKKTSPDEVIWSGATGWLESFHDGIKDGTAGMKGTSMSTPHVAGLVACLLSDGVVSNADDVKKYIKETFNDTWRVKNPYEGDREKELLNMYNKSISYGWGLMKLSRFKRRKRFTRRKKTK